MNTWYQYRSKDGKVKVPTREGKPLLLAVKGYKRIYSEPLKPLEIPQEIEEREGNRRHNRKSVV